MPREILAKIERYLTEIYHDGKDSQTGSLSAKSLMADLPNLVTSRFQETRETSVGPMRVHYAQISCGKNVNQWIDAQLRDLAIHRRILYVAAALAGVLAALAMLWVYLKARMAPS